MRLNRIAGTAALMLALAAGNVAIGLARQQEKPVAPDNTRVNKRDQTKGNPTADQAKETRTDREIMAEIRKSVVADKSLSTYAHNVKIISQHGKVTLKGPVHSEEEKKAIEAKAIEVAGAGNVTNQLTVKP
jgi:hyperosmotically inducible periplasmic protein